MVGMYGADDKGEAVRFQFLAGGNTGKRDIFG